MYILFYLLLVPSTLPRRPLLCYISLFFLPIPFLSHTHTLLFSFFLSLFPFFSFSHFFLFFLSLLFSFLFFSNISVFLHCIMPWTSWLEYLEYKLLLCDLPTATYLLHSFSNRYLCNTTFHSISFPLPPNKIVTPQGVIRHFWCRPKQIWMRFMRAARVSWDPLTSFVLPMLSLATLSRILRSSSLSQRLLVIFTWRAVQTSLPSTAFGLFKVGLLFKS